MDLLSKKDLEMLRNEEKEKVRERWTPQKGQTICNLLVGLPQEMKVGHVISKNFDSSDGLYFFVEYTSGWWGGVWKNESLPILTRRELNSVLTNKPS